MTPTATVLALLLAAALPLEVQGQGTRRSAPADVHEGGVGLVLSVHPLLYTGFGTVTDPGTQSRWLFADAALGGGAALHVGIGGDLLLGAEATYARTNYERRPRAAQSVLDAGTAAIGTVFVSGRISGRGLGGLAQVGGMRGLGGLARLGYLTAGAGAIVYDLENVDGANADLAFQLGGGLELLSARGRGGFLELKQIWGFHEREGVDDSTVRHTRLDLGVRFARQRPASAEARAR